jgi:hypothetical protein
LTREDVDLLSFFRCYDLLMIVGVSEIDEGVVEINLRFKTA